MRRARAHGPFKAHHRFMPGVRVAHIALDEHRGTARVGVVTEVIGEGEGALVVARWDDTGETEAYDERELVPLMGRFSGGPAFLDVRHLWRWLFRRSGGSGAPSA